MSITALNPVPMVLRTFINKYGDAQFSNTEPSAPMGAENVAWQTDGFGKISAFVPLPNQQSYADYTAFGDSITAGVGASIPANDYVSLLGTLYGAVVTNNGVGGYQAADVSRLEGIFNSSPVDSNNPLVTLMIGTNDASEEGVGGYEENYNLICQAIISWMCSSSSQKYTGASFGSVPTNWSLDTTFTVNGLKTTTQGATSSWPVTTSNGPVAIWYRIIDGNGGVFTYSVDGGAPVEVSNSTSVPIGPTPVGDVTDAVGVVFIEGLDAGSHTITITATSATSGSNIVSIIGVGTTPLQTFFSPPSIFVGGVPFQESDNQGVATAAYNQDQKSNVSTLAAMGFNVRFVDVRGYWGPNPVGFYNTEHPNDLGHSELYQGFSASINGIPASNTTVYQYGPVASFFVPSGDLSYTASATDNVLYWNPGTDSNPRPLILGSLGQGKYITIVNYGSGNIQISCDGGTASGFIVGPNASATFNNGGGAFWFVTGSYVPA